MKQGLDDAFDRKDIETERRRLEIFEKIDARKRKQIIDGKSSASSYKAVVREVEVYDPDGGAIMAVLNKLFQTGRKLKPIVK